MKNVDIEVLFNGRPAKIHNHENKLFLEGKEGSEYEIRITNDNNYRILAILGVDCINVINGQENTKDSPGYLIEKHNKLIIRGYRISDDECSSFKFTKKGDSYANSKTISAQNGIISLNVYKEYEKPEPIVVKEYIPYNPWSRPIWYDYGSPVFPNYPFVTWCGGITSQTNYHVDCYIGDPPGSCQGLGNSVNNSSFSNKSSTLSNDIKCCNMSAVFNEVNPNMEVRDNINDTPSNHFELGSSFGSVKESKVINVDFVKGEYLGEINIYYTTRAKLIEMGIKFTTVSTVVFPKGTSGYCSPPKDWKR